MRDFKKFYKSTNSSSPEKYFDYMDRSFDTQDIIGKLLSDRIVFLTTEIDSYVSNMVKAQLLYLNQQSNDDIKLYIDSPGGEIYTSMGLIDVMEYIESDIETVNIGLAASMGAVLLASGTKGKRKSLKRSRIMIHQPLGYSGFQQASDHEIDAKEISYLKKELYKILSEKSGQSIGKVEKDGDRDYWMSADDGLKYGIIDKIIKK